MIITGGVSVGEHDLVQSTLRELGAKIDIWAGRNQTGSRFCLADSATVLFRSAGKSGLSIRHFSAIGAAALLKLMGATNIDLPTVQAKLAVDLTNDGYCAHYFRGRIDNGTFAPVGRQESHALFGLSRLQRPFTPWPWDDVKSEYNGDGGDV